MEITRTELSEIIVTEVRRRLRELVEKDDGGKKRSKGPKKPDTVDASAARGKGPKGPDDAADIDGPSVDRPDPVAQGDEEEGNDRPEPDDVAAIDSDGDGGEEPSGVINDEMSGKTIQAISVEPRSKVLPGAKEVVIATNESTDQLRILVTATGEVKFFWRGQLMDLP